MAQCVACGSPAILLPLYFARQSSKGHIFFTPLEPMQTIYRGAAFILFCGNTCAGNCRNRLTAALTEAGLYLQETKKGAEASLAEALLKL